MLYFRKEEKAILRSFVSNDRSKAMAVYGRRRTGKTELMLDYIAGEGKLNSIYYQCTSYSYQVCFSDFIGVVTAQIGEDRILRALSTFRDAFQYLSETGKAEGKVFIIDEFPFLAKRDENVAVEFQWIIDHALKGIKIILLGSSLSFMKSQINDSSSPLYGRFDEILEIRPFTFSNIRELFPNFEDAVDVFAQTGGVAQYVMFFREYPSVREATEALFLNRNGRLFAEASNLLMQELRDVTTYVSILRSIGTGEKESGKIAEKCGMDPRNVFTYLSKLIDLEIVTAVNNPLDSKKANHRYRISDSFFRFNYSFIEPNISMITSVGPRSGSYILDDRYKEFCGIVYEDIIRSGCFEYAANGKFPFMPGTIGKWWGNIRTDGSWNESEIDVIAFDERHIILGECKYRSKAVGMKELDNLKIKASFVPVKGRIVYFLLASKSGFTSELNMLHDDSIILIDKA